MLGGKGKMEETTNTQRSGMGRHNKEGKGDTTVKNLKKGVKGKEIPKEERG